MPPLPPQRRAESTPTGYSDLDAWDEEGGAGEDVEAFMRSIQVSVPTRDANQGPSVDGFHVPASHWKSGCVDATRTVVGGRLLSATLAHTVGVGEVGPGVDSVVDPVAAAWYDSATQTFRALDVWVEAHWLSQSLNEGQRQKVELKPSLVAALAVRARGTPHGQFKVTQPLLAVTVSSPPMKQATEHAQGRSVAFIARRQDMPPHWLELMAPPPSLAKDQASTGVQGGVGPARDRQTWVDRARTGGVAVVDCVGGSVVGCVAIVAAGVLWMVLSLVGLFREVARWETFAVADEHVRATISVGSAVVGMGLFVYCGEMATERYRVSVWVLTYLPVILLWVTTGVPLPFSKIMAGRSVLGNTTAVDWWIILYVVVILFTTLVYTILLLNLWAALSPGFTAVFFLANVLVWLGVVVATAQPWVDA